MQQLLFEDFPQIAGGETKPTPSHVNIRRRLFLFLLRETPAVSDEQINGPFSTAGCYIFETKNRYPPQKEIRLL